MPLTEAANNFYFGNINPAPLSEYDANGNLIYEGYALPGTSQSVAGWVIIKHTYTPVTIGGATIYQDTYDSTLDGVKWSLRALYSFP